MWRIVLKESDRLTCVKSIEKKWKMIDWLPIGFSLVQKRVHNTPMIILVSSYYSSFSSLSFPWCSTFLYGSYVLVRFFFLHQLLRSSWIIYRIDWSFTLPKKWRRRKSSFYRSSSHLSVPLWIDFFVANLIPFLLSLMCQSF